MNHLVFDFPKENCQEAGFFAPGEKWCVFFLGVGRKGFESDHFRVGNPGW